MKPHEKPQTYIDRMLFRGGSSKTSVYLTYAIGNVIVMFLLFFVLLSNVLYDWVGHLYPIGAGFRLDFLFGGLDDLIPFVPEMVIFYLYLYVAMAILTMVYFAFIEYRRGYALGWSLVFVETIALIIYVIFPVSVLVWHQDLLTHPIVGDVWATQVYNMVASFSTAFNTFPSMHAAVSTMCFYTWYQYSKVKPGRATKTVAIMALVISAGTILSTLFLKQHYIADEIAGIVLAWGTGRLLFSHLWKPLDLTRSLVNKKAR